MKITLFVSDVRFAEELGNTLLAGLIYAIGWVVYWIGEIADFYNKNIKKIDKVLGFVVLGIILLFAAIFMSGIVPAIARIPHIVEEASHR